MNNVERRTLCVNLKKNLCRKFSNNSREQRNCARENFLPFSHWQMWAGRTQCWFVLKCKFVRNSSCSEREKKRIPFEQSTLHCVPRRENRKVEKYLSRAIKTGTARVSVWFEAFFDANEMRRNLNGLEKAWERQQNETATKLCLLKASNLLLCPLEATSVQFEGSGVFVALKFSFQSPWKASNAAQSSQFASKSLRNSF